MLARVAPYLAYLLVPASSKYYEVSVEASGALSKLLSSSRTSLGRAERLIRALELLLEKSSALLGGEGIRLRVVLVIELVKTILRLRLLLRHQASMFVSWEMHTSLTLQQYEQWSQSEAERRPSIEFTGRRSGIVVCRQSHGKPDAANSMLTPQRALILGEALYVIRPLLLALLSERMHALSSELIPELIPVLASLALEIVSIQMTEYALGRVGGSRTTRQHAFQVELRRRKLAVLYLLLRFPVFNRVLQPSIEGLGELLQAIPMAKRSLSALSSALAYLNRSHFYTSASS